MSFKVQKNANVFFVCVLRNYWPVCIALISSLLGFFLIPVKVEN